VQLGICRLDSRSSVAQKEKNGKRGGKNIENNSVSTRPGEGRAEFIAETPFDFPGRNLFEKSRSRI